MKKIIAIICSLFLLFPLWGQNLLHLYQGNSVVFEKQISEIDSIKFNGYNSIFNYDSDQMIFAISEIDSVTFSPDSMMNTPKIYITWQGNTVSITNPLASQGVTVSANAADVTVLTSAGITGIEYVLSGTTSGGSLVISSDKNFKLCMNGVSITNPSGPAIQVVLDQKVTVDLVEGTTNVLADASGHTKKAAFQSKGQLIFKGTGTLQVTGNAKNGIHSDDYIKINSGNINVLSAVNDGIHCDYFIMNDGQLTVNNVGSDAVDGDEGFIQINGGTIHITLPTADTKGLKCDSTITINDGNITMTVAGNQGKGIKSGKNTYINGGTINITASGNVVLETVTGYTNRYNPAYCSAIKSDSMIVISGGNTTLTCTSANKGGKGLSADGDIIMNDGYLTITTAGAGATYTNASGTTDSYTCACIKGDANVQLLGGTINCSSSGSGGKGINVEGTLTIGKLNSPDSLLNLTVGTSGARFQVSGSSGGGGWPPGPGGDGDYANPKAIKSMGNLTINSGTITVNCTQTGEGGEGIESKAILNINGGILNITSVGDDAINASSRLNINGGTTYATSTNNDAIDCNGPMYITGGFTIAAANKSPEEAFDCDNYTFGITGGTIVGTAVSGNMFSSPTASACTQHSLKYTHAANTSVQIIRNSDNQVVLTFHIPTLSSGGGGFPGGGSSSAVMTFTSPEFTAGSYTLKYGGTISGGTNFHNYYTGATYTGGSTKTFTVGSAYSITSVN